MKMRDVFLCIFAVIVADCTYLQCDPASAYAPWPPDAKDPGALSSPERLQHVLEDYDRMLADPRYDDAARGRIQSGRDAIVAQGVTP
jgi:hypothetical protein